VSGASSTDGTKAKFSVYPNPCIDKLQIAGKQIINSIKIFNISGQVVGFESKLNTNKYTLEMSDFDKGVYFILVKYDDSAISYKVIKKE
jgi:predicted acetyltransferase